MDKAREQINKIFDADPQGIYLIWSMEHGAWWRKDERGYTIHIDEAGWYQTADAKRIVENANTVYISEVAIPLSFCAVVGTKGSVWENDSL